MGQCCRYQLIVYLVLINALHRACLQAPEIRLFSRVRLYIWSRRTVSAQHLSPYFEVEIKEALRNNRLVGLVFT